MSVLWDKDWRYKIVLDKHILHDVTSFAKSIKNKDASKAMLSEIDFYKKPRCKVLLSYQDLTPFLHSFIVLLM